MSGPIRGLHDVEGKLFAVSGSQLYQINNAGVAIPRGSVPGVGRVSMAHNLVNGGNQLLVVNGSAGYVYNTATTGFEKVTDDGYPGSAVVDFMDGFLVGVDPFGRFLFHSDLADALGYNTLDRFDAETAPDPTVGMIVNHQEVWAFGARTIDVFGNTGAATGTFQNKGVSITKGCIAKFTPAIIDSGAAWLGHDRVVYHARGYDPVRISTRAIEVALSQAPLTAIQQAFSFVWEDRGHSVYYLTVPGYQTWGYDFSTGLWHRRASHNDMTGVGGRWRINDLVHSNGRWIGGDFQNGKLYVLDWDYMREGCEELVRERVSAVLHNDADSFTIDRLELQFDTGGPATECVEFPYQPAGPSIEGEAPDGEIGEPYEFAYTVTPGGAPVAKTVIRSGTLVPGIAFDESTATLSGTPETGGYMALELRTYDTNGLYADHSDLIEFMGEVLWDQETASGGTGSVLDDGVVWMASTNAAGYVTADTSVSDGDWYWEHTSRWYRVSGSGIAHWSMAGIIRLDDSAWGMVMRETGGDGGGVNGSGGLVALQVIDPNWIPPSSNTLASARIRNRLTFNSGVATWMVAVDDGEWIEAMPAESGTFAPYAASRGPSQDGLISARRVFIYSRPSDFLYEVPEGARPLGMAAGND